MRMLLLRGAAWAARKGARCCMAATALIVVAPARPDLLGLHERYAHVNCRTAKAMHHARRADEAPWRAC